MIKGDAAIIGKKLKAKTKKRLAHLPGQMLLRIHEDAVRPHLGGTRLKLSTSETERLPAAITDPLAYLRQNAGLKAVDPLFSTRRVGLQRATFSSMDRAKLAVLSSVSDSESEELAGITMVSLDPKKVTAKLMRHLRSSKAVEFVEPMPARWLAGGEVDPLQNLQWGLRIIKWFMAPIPEASGIRVGVLDTGIDMTHPDLKNVDITYHHAGFKARDILGHGTHVTGIIAATANNRVGITGVAACKVSMWKVFPDKPIGGDFYVDGECYLQALNAVIREGVRVVNLSLGGTESSQTEALLFRRLERRGIIVVAAMGNEYEEGNPTEYPAAYEGVCSVGALAENGRRARFSNTGRHIDLVAPGSNILSTAPTKDSPYLDETNYASWSGTSMATPYVAAATALVATRYPDKDASQIKEHLRQTTTRLAAMGSRAWTSAYGTGLLNLQKALV